MKFSFENILSFCLVIPTYFIFLVGHNPSQQAFAYSLYAIPLLFLFLNRKIEKIPLRILGFLVLFLFLWITPSFINYFNNKLDVLNIFILLYHAFFFTVIFLTFYYFFNFNDETKFKELCTKLLILIFPLAFLIFLDSTYQFFSNNYDRPYPFSNHPNFATEILLAALILSTNIKWQSIKNFLLLFVIFICYICSSRGALVASLIIFISPKILGIFKLLFFKNKFYFLLALFLFTLVIYYFFNILSTILLLDIRLEALNERIYIWKIGIESFLNNPFLGIGFWNNPHTKTIEFNNSIFNIHTINPNLVIHNAFIRIAVENGLGLLLLSLLLLFFSLFNFYKEDNFICLSVLIAFIFYLFFATRHLSLNFFNILLYLYIYKSYFLKKSFN